MAIMLHLAQLSEEQRVGFLSSNVEVESASLKANLTRSCVDG